MTDGELLELAARAAGIKYTIKDGVFVAHGNKNEPPIPWNPLDDDGDALRLAVKLGIDLLFTFEDVEAVATMHARQEDQEMISPWACESWTLKKQDPYVATRRAIVLAAAEIGRAMK